MPGKVVNHLIVVQYDDGSFHTHAPWENPTALDSLAGAFALERQRHIVGRGADQNN